MAEPGSTAASGLALAVIYIWSMIEQLHPGAAGGASLGCFFFLAFPDPAVGKWYEQAARKCALLVFSWGAGYSVGAGMAESAEWANWAKAGAVSTAALSATLFGAFNLMIRNDGPLPRWLGAIIDRIPVIRGSSND